MLRAAGLHRDHKQGLQGRLSWAILAPPLPSSVTLSQWLTLSEPRFPHLQSTDVSDTTSQSVRIECDKSEKALSTAWVTRSSVTVRQVMIFASKYHCILFECDLSLRKIVRLQGRAGSDCVHRQIWDLGGESPVLGSYMS